MKVKETYWGKDVSIQEALSDLMCDYTAPGELERIKYDLTKMREVLVRFMAQHIKTVDDLNALADYIERMPRSTVWDEEASAELRRLDALNAELVKTLKWLDNWLGEKPMPECVKRIQAALAKAKEQT